MGAFSLMIFKGENVCKIGSCPLSGEGLNDENRLDERVNGPQQRLQIVHWSRESYHSSEPIEEIHISKCPGRSQGADRLGQGMSELNRGAGAGEELLDAVDGDGEFGDSAVFVATAPGVGERLAE